MTRRQGERPGSVVHDPSSSPNAVVRQGEERDAAAVAFLHDTQISEGFLATLGRAFLSRLYRRIMRSSTSFLLVADQGGQVVGFVAGAVDVGGLYRSFILRDGLLAAAAAARNLVPAWRKALETARHGGSGAAGKGRGPELLAIAVSPESEGRGVGGHLVAAFLREVTDRGCTSAYVVVAADNQRAVALYERAGFVLAGQFELHAGTSSNVMQWDRDPGRGGNDGRDPDPAVTP